MNELITIARRINERETTIETLRKQTLDKVNATLCEVLLQGQDLIEMKARCAHGNWINWLRVNCPTLSERRAQRYMALARSASARQQVGEAQSLRNLLMLCDMEADRTQADPKRWPSYMEAIGRLSKLAGYVKRYPIMQWPNEGVEKFREEMLPLARGLWPDKFADEDKTAS